MLRGRFNRGARLTRQCQGIWHPRGLASSAAGQEGADNAATPSPQSPSSSSPVPSPLRFTLPDLSPLEASYVQRQVDFLAKLPSTAAQLQPFHPVVDAIRQMYFPSFLHGKKKGPERMQKALRRPLQTYRNCETLVHFGIEDAEVEEHPDLLFYSSKGLVPDLLDRHVLEVPLADVRSAKKKRPLRGKFIMDRMRDVQSSLQALGLTDSDHSRLMEEGVSLSRHKTAFTFEKLDEAMVGAFVNGAFDRDRAGQVLSVWRNEQGPRKRRADSKMFIRNFYLLTRVLSHPLEYYKTSRLLRNLCPLEILVSLNDLDQALDIGGGARPSTQQDLLQMMHFRYIYNLSAGKGSVLPFSVRKRLLLDIGFTPSGANEVILANSCAFSDSSAKSKGGSRLCFSSPGYVPEMSRRLQLVRSNQDVLGLTSSEQYIHCLTQWHPFLHQVKSIAEKGEQGKALQVKNSFKERNHPQSGKTTATAIFLTEVFGTEPDNDVIAKARDEKKFNLYHVKEVLAFLKGKGFGLDEIKRNMLLLQHSVATIAAHLQELEDSHEAEELRSNFNLLSMVHYLIERRNGFTGEAVCAVGSCDFSDELYKEVETVTGSDVRKCRVDDDADSLDDDPPPPPRGRRGSGTRREIPAAVPLQASSFRNHGQEAVASLISFARGFSSSVAASNPTFDAEDFNIFKQVKVASQFERLRLEGWDPNITIGSFEEASKFALCCVTNRIASNEYDELRGLIAQDALQRLRNEIEETLPDVQQRTSVGLDESDVQRLTIDSVRMHHVAYERYCDVDVRLRALKDVENTRLEMLIRARFSRDYTPGKLPNWVITRFGLEKVRWLK